MNWERETGHAIDFVADHVRLGARFSSRISDIRTTRPLKKS